MLFLAVEKVRNCGLDSGLDPEILKPSSKIPLVLITGHRRESFGENSDPSAGRSMILRCLSRTVCLSGT
jgi:hypothetical protein